MTPKKPVDQQEKKPGKNTEKAAENNAKNMNELDESRIIRAVIEDEMKSSYLDYAMSVIVGRALPDIRDGLKPVHRRILFAMNDIGIKYKTPFKKCARIVGEVLGKYHPHGDTAVYDALVRMAQSFSLRYPLIQGQGNFGCFTKDTQVQLADGRKLSFGELIEEYTNGKKNYTYTVDNGKIKIAEIKKPRLTIKNTKIMKVVLDNGEEIRCTLNHKFMLRKEEYKEAQDLKPGDSLMPFYTRISTKEEYSADLAGYQVILQPKTNKWMFSHNLADEYNLAQGAYLKSKGRVRHHKDFNKVNNNPENVERMQWGEHWKLHAKLVKDRHATDKEYVEKLAQGRKRFWDNPKNREEFSKRLSKRNIENWKKQEYRSKMIETLSKVNKEYLKKHPEQIKIISKRASATLKRLWQNPEYRKKMREKIIKGNKNHITNITGKKKFLNICRAALEKEGTINSFVYELYRNVVYPYGHAPLWENGFEKYYHNKDFLDLVNEACANHKVKSTKILNYTEDVYDLTIDKTNNFALAVGVFVHNSIDGDNAAAMRYTEARMAKISDEMLSDIDKDTVEFQPNFDGSLKEPIVMPSKTPNLLINGSSGIAVGMATNIPPHNINEVCTAVVTLIGKPGIEINELLKIIKGPDFPTGGIILGKRGIIETYTHGRGSIKIRGKIELEEKKDKQSFVITEIPYQLNKSQLIEQIADAVNDKTIQGISDLRDESDRKGMRIVLELKKSCNQEIVKNQLYKHTRLQSTFGAIMLGLDKGQPKILNIKQLLESFLVHRRVVVRRRTKFDLRKADDRAHILKGLMVALQHLDHVIKLIKTSKNPVIAKKNLITVYKLSDKQSQAILDMKLQRLTGLEQQRIKDEHKELLELIKKLKEILADEKKILEIIKKEMNEIMDKYSDERRTMIEEAVEEEIDLEDLIKPEENVITISHAGYIKRQAVDVYKTQRRGGKGVRGASTREEDFIKHLFVANTHSYLLVFTDKGKVYWLKVYNIPEATRISKGKPIVNLIRTDPDEKIQAVIPVREFNDKRYLLFATRKGLVKKTNLNAYSRPRQGGIIAINLNQGDGVVEVVLTNGQRKILIASSNGQAVKFFEADARPVGRNSTGVRGIRLGKEDIVIGMIIARDNETVLALTENGYGKRTRIEEYRLISRGGKGVRNIICSQRNGKVVGIRGVKDDDELMVVSKKGILIRIPVKNISVIGRNTQGVRIMKLGEGDSVVSIAKIESNGNDKEEIKQDIEELPEEPDNNSLAAGSELKEQEERRSEASSSKETEFPLEIETEDSEKENTKEIKED